MARIIFSLHGSAVLVAGTASLLLFTGCVGDMPHSGGWTADSHNKRVQQAYGISTGPRYAAIAVPVPSVPVVVKASPAPPAASAKPKVKTAHPSAQRKRRKH